MTVKIPIEIDITYANKAWYRIQRGNPPKHYIIGILQRGIYGKNPVASIFTMDDNKPETITGIIESYIPHGALLYVEENMLPESLKEFYEIKELRVSQKEWVRGDIHVNNVKNMWKDLKRKIKQVHVWVSEDHLQSYCNEVAWHINNAHLNHMEKFNLLLNAGIKTSPTSQKNLVKKKHRTLTP